MSLPEAPRWAIIQRNSTTGKVELILWSRDNEGVSAGVQEDAMMRHPDILKVWRLEEIK